jgi:hypothetical protein
MTPSMVRSMCVAFFLCAAFSADARSNLVYSQTVIISGQSNKVISGQHYRSITGNCLQIINSHNITVEDSVFDSCVGLGVLVQNSTGIIIGVWQHGNTFAHFDGGVYALSSQGVKVQYNDFRDVRRRSGSSRGQFVQFDKVTGAGNAITGNTGGNVVGSNPEDLINMWMSNGTTTSPIDITENCFESPIGAATSGSGSGIMLGDGGGSYQYAHSNILINPGQVGIGQAGGTNIKAEFNRIYGARDAETNVGMYVWNESSGQCSGWMGRNSIKFTNAAGQDNPVWDGGNCTDGSFTAMWDSNDTAAAIENLHCPAFNNH